MHWMQLCMQFTLAKPSGSRHMPMLLTFIPISQPLASLVDLVACRPQPGTSIQATFEHCLDGTYLSRTVRLVRMHCIPQCAMQDIDLPEAFQMAFCL